MRRSSTSELHAEALRIRRAQAVAQRIGFMQACDCVGGRCGKTRGRVERLVGNGLRGFAQRLLVIGGQLESRAPAQRSSSCAPDSSAFSTSSPTSTLICASCSQEAYVSSQPSTRCAFAELLLDVGIAIFPRLQVAVVADLDHRFPAVQAGLVQVMGKRAFSVPRVLRTDTVARPWCGLR